MNYQGIIIGASAFLIIGLLHPIVVKAEYHVGARCWPAFLIAGVACLILSFAASAFVPSALFSVLGFSLLWSIRELFEQEQRVKKGWFPANPRKENDTAS